MKKGLFIFIFLLFASFIFAADNSEFTGSSLSDFNSLSGVIDIAGGTAHIPVMNAAAQKIMRHNGRIKITVAGGGSGAGVKQVGEGLVNIGNTGRALKESEIAQYGLKTYPFAIDGVAVVVHPANSVSSLTSTQVQNIFAGKTVNWKELGGKDAAINLYTREEGSGTREVFADILLKEVVISQKAVIINSNGAMKTAVAGDLNGIGYVGIGFTDKSVKGVVLDGIPPTQKNASTGVYKVTRLLYMNTRGEPDKLTGTFIRYITGSADGRKFIEDAGYIPIK
ncbi:MAG: phosphate ABC transporter substrate-binding protein [Deferribacteraceae bacterium]|jgi:phosphate transport system substrate-binding protein|nr:phosphate ABC transporter substrate-binding protein [Deferribacteraceae bacterium]